MARQKITRYAIWQVYGSNASFALFGGHETKIVKKSKALNFQNTFSQGVEPCQITVRVQV